jgi:hypothetical protein
MEIRSLEVEMKLKIYHPDLLIFGFCMIGIGAGWFWKGLDVHNYSYWLGSAVIWIVGAYVSYRSTQYLP